MNLKRIIISRTDSIGDVVLTLPMAGILKKKYPNCKIFFLGRTYTEAIISTSTHIDEFINWDKLQKKVNPIAEVKKINADAIIHVFPNREVAYLAYKAKIPLRIGTSGRMFHLINCNKKVVFSRKKSHLHEAQLNLKLLAPLKINNIYSLKEIEGFYGIKNLKSLHAKVSGLLDKSKMNIILHPKSKGSAKEWGLNNFANLIEILPEDKFQIFITGTNEEKKLVGNTLQLNKPNVVSLLGKLTLDELISFISNIDAFVSASTGPLHIAAALGVRSIGLYSPRRPMHPGRWKPIGKRAVALVKDENCSKCLARENCNCISEISPKIIMGELFCA